MKEKILTLLFVFVFYACWLFVKLLTLLAFLLRIKAIRKFFRSRNHANKKISVLYLDLCGDDSAGNIYRALKWCEILNANNFKAKSKHILLYKDLDALLKKPTGALRFYMLSLFIRTAQCIVSIRYDIVIVRREILPFNDYGNLFLEKFMSAIHPSLVLDFDDDIVAAKKEPRSVIPFGKMMLDNPTKWISSLKYFNYFIPGTSYLESVMQKHFNVKDSKILIVPTCVDYEKFPPHQYDLTKDEIVLGWAGTRGHLKYLDEIIPALNKTAAEFSIRLLVICNQKYEPATANFPIENIAWTKENEIENLKKMDVGIMPLHDDDEERGKCGFKLIQYMGCGIVSVASAITFNNEIVDDGVNSFLVKDGDDWFPVLKKVLSEMEKFPAMGKLAFEKVKNKFSFNANSEKYIQFLRRVYQS